MYKILNSINKAIVDISNKKLNTNSKEFILIHKHSGLLVWNYYYPIETIWKPLLFSIDDNDDSISKSHYAEQSHWKTETAATRKLIEEYVTRVL